MEKTDMLLQKDLYILSYFQNGRSTRSDTKPTELADHVGPISQMVRHFKMVSSQTDQVC